MLPGAGVSPDYEQPRCQLCAIRPSPSAPPALGLLRVGGSPRQKRNALSVDENRSPEFVGSHCGCERGGLWKIPRLDSGKRQVSLLVGCHGEAPTAARTTGLEHLLAAFGTVTLSEPVGSQAARVTRLERAFHGRTPSKGEDSAMHPRPRQGNKPSQLHKNTPGQSAI